MGKSKLVRPSFLSCFSCGLAELPGDGSDVAGTKPNGDAPTIGPAPVCCKDGANGASGSLASPLDSNSSSRPATARRPSTAFRESSPAGPLAREPSPARKSRVTSAAVGEDAAAPPSAPTVAPGTPPPYLVTAGAAAALAAVNTLSGCEAFPSRRQPRKPHVRTSRVSPAYDTEDELSPAVLSRSPSGSVDESSFPSYSPSLEEEPLRDVYGETNDAETDDAETDGATALMRGRGPVTDADSREATGDGGGDAAAGFGVQILAFPGASVGGTVLLSTATGASSSPSAAERPGPVPGGGGGAAGAAAAAAARVAPVAAADGDGAPRAGGGGGGAVTARRGSFAGDSSTSLVGPASVSTPPDMRNCPSLRPTARGSSPPPSPPPQPLGQCVSLRLSPLPLPPPPAAAALETCGSLRLSPLSPQRLLAPSPTLHPTPLLLPSPSLNRRPPSQDLDLLMLLPGAQASETSPPTHGSAAGDQMLRLAPPPPPQQQPLLQQDSPCSLERSAFPRANTLAPLPVENTAALNRLASLQAAFKGRQLLGSQPTAAAAAALHPSDDVGGSDDEDTAARDAVDECWPSPATHGSAAADASMVPLWLEVKPHLAASSERAGGAAAAAMAAAAADASAIAAAAAAAKTTSAATARSGAGACGDNQHKKDEYDEYDDDVASMVSHLLPPSCFRSSAPAVPYGGGAAPSAVTKEQHVRRTGSLEHPGPATAAAAADAAKAKCTAPLSDPGAPAPPPPPPPAAVAGLVSEPALGSDPASLGTHAVKWLEELLPPPSPGYRSSNGPMGRSNLGLPAAGRRPAAMQAADSFKCLMREIE
ncbi:hypothetical protein PLESTB_001567100 [Pleodorina starrii]|uniref:Uncharacterized protein n=1 Tax=Pleodorina starrii TaxID=330485 RepID=A0A9W6F8B1_9CHLO|nr:hypothetical protein PLESTB_001567100 [Pleodorina starrii]GLC72731.1 hypothetical protein PLESTF_001287100 [Pleodorina starrii]